MKYLSKLSTCCRKANNNGFLIGMILGLIISLLFYQMSSISNLDTSSSESKAPWSYLSLSHENSNTDYELTNQINRVSSSDQVDEYAPKLKNPSSLHIQDSKQPWRFTRPRYYFTELGIREKLFLGVLTDPEHLHSRGVTFNKTVGQFIEKIRYFITISGSENGNKKPNVSLSGIVGFTDTRKILKPFHVVKYIIDNYLEEYDYYYIVKDTSYVNARQLMNLVESFSVGINKDIYLGVPISEKTLESSNYISDNLINFCSLDAGIIISNSIMRQLKKNLDWCVKNTFLYSSSDDDVNFGRCLYYTTKTPCNNKLFRSNQVFLSKKIPAEINLTNLTSYFLDDLVSVYPILDPKVIYKLHAYAAARELKRIEDEIIKLRNEISSSAHLSPTNKTTSSWPVGISPGNKAPGRFDILRWNFFNETHIFMETDFDNVTPLVGSKKLEVDFILKTAKKLIKEKYDGKFKYEKLVNGYMKFDASRGMDYILDLRFEDGNNKVVKRVELCKPLGKVELLPVPYVTENTRVNLILIVDKDNVEEAIKFMENYGAVFLYTDSTKVNDIYAKVKTQVVNLTEKYNKSKDLSKIIWLSIQLPEVEDPRVNIAITDLIIKKFSPESLILFVQTQMELTTDYLNRIRMNTINQWQVFSPIPFVEYNPNLYQTDQKSNFDLNHNHGYYDKLNYQSISFYVKDYRSARRASEKIFPVIHSDREIKQLPTSTSSGKDLNSVFKLFVLFSDLHVFRAIEPALKLRYSDKNNCKSLLGHRGQLARLIDEYQKQVR
ncbi:Similar to CHPF: Chondroitin sulfate synthase 2 (Homo sapiens) [Cotesia congregata]|uniref:Hexosyltransferase n=1 Tax=Cotesia congregata TaxID=51543 RepID=A0A8J2MK91_COTCN|nr:Similar to CHPF: Chondroitin sulfate synthase 2 (Homo sapiens) [Cotesia congregata]